MAKNKASWEEQFDHLTGFYNDPLAQSDSGEFGRNCILYDAKKFFKKIAKNAAKLEILDNYTIRITLPPKTYTDLRDKIFLLLLIDSSPSPTTCKYNNK